MRSPQAAPDPYLSLPSVAGMTLASPDVRDTAPLALAHVSAAAGGEDVSPELIWSDAPAGTRSYAVTCFDPDAPTGSGFWHWFVVGLPAETTRLERGAGLPAHEGLPAGAIVLCNDAGVRGYTGAAPPPGQPHRYLFAIHALDTEDVGVGPDASCAYGGFLVVRHALARGVLCPTYGGLSAGLLS